MSLIDEYRAYAAECLRLAQNASDEGERARLLTMAEAWHDLANKAGKSGTPRIGEERD